MNYHSHDYRDEVWTVISGTGRAIVDGIERRVNVGDVITMPAGSKHTVIADKVSLQLIEVQLGAEISASDKHKYKLDI
jgi:mannose-1-phosphate guanylyltransferase